MTIKKQPSKNNSKAIEVSREAPEERKQAVHDFLMPLFNDAQMRLLVNKTPAYAIQKRVGGNGMMLSYVKHGYVTDQLNKAFGFDWDLVLEPVSNGQMYALQIEEIPRVDGKTNKPLPSKIVRHVAVCGYLVVRVHDGKGNVKGEIRKSGFGSQLWLPSMEFGDALKAAKSDLLKVCAAQVGVALDLYWNDVDEVSKFEDEQERKRKQDEQDIVDALATDIDDDYPANGVSLIAKASSLLGLNGHDVARILGKDGETEQERIGKVINEFKASDWDTILLEVKKNGKKGR